ncbi:MAG: integrase core domain-containing protein [Ilumatobacteraceae bacterium]|nr:integrase core domain-containing protein [Ilumatobacteraceae bacterium]
MHRYRFATSAEARRAICSWNNRYNMRRRHSSHGYIAPIKWQKRLLPSHGSSVVRFSSRAAYARPTCT